MKTLIWIIGADGMLGSTFCDFFANLGISFLGTTIHDVDICQEEQIHKFIKNKRFTHIINCAAYTQVDLAEREKEKAYEVNAKAPFFLAQAARENHSRFIHFSTDYVFDGRKKKAYVEEDIPNPINEYGKTKYEGEKKIFQELPSACVIRTSWLFAKGESSFVAKMIRLMKKQKNVSVVNDQIGRPTLAEDLTEATYHLMDQEGIFHFANQQEATWYDMTLFIYEKMLQGKHKLTCKSLIPIKTEAFPTLAKRPLYSVLCTSKYEKITKRKPRLWQEALEAHLKERKI